MELGPGGGCFRTLPYLFTTKKVNDAFVGPCGVKKAPQEATQEAPVGQGPEEAHQAPRTLGGPAGPDDTSGHPEIPSKPVPFQHAHEAPRRGHQEATQEFRGRPLTRPAQVPGRTLAGLHWTPGHHRGVTPQRLSRPMLIGFATLSSRNWSKIHGPRRNIKTLLVKLCVVHRVFTKHI